MNPFKVFDVEQKFEIENLDEKYYTLFSKYQDQSKLNRAYKILKDPVARAIMLCSLNGFSIPDFQIAKEVMNMQVTKEMLVAAEKNIFESALKQDWANAWIWAQKYSYIKRILG